MITKVGNAQEAEFVKLRAAFAFQNLSGPWQGSGLIVQVNEELFLALITCARLNIGAA